MWSYCPRCNTTDQPELIPVVEVEIILAGKTPGGVVEDKKEIPNEQKTQYRAICERCGYEETYDDD